MSAFIYLRGIGLPFGRKVLGLAFYVQLSRVFFNNITVNLRYNESVRLRRSVECWNLICDMFTYYYNHLRR